jgi:hypothetical protein
MEEVLTREADGPSALRDGRKPFGGVVRIQERERVSSSSFRARQSLSRDSIFQAVKDEKDWPKTWTIKNKPIPEKAEPHAATFLVRHDGPESKLAIYWGVFLPTGEKPNAIIPIDAPGGGTAIDLHVFLHGYFFVESCRRYVMGLELSSGPSGSAYADICAKWNRLVRDRVTLPMLPGVLADALREAVLSSSDLARTVRALASDRWFVEHRGAIASREQLAEVWNGRKLEWRTLSSGTGLRPIPAPLLSRPDTLSRVFPELISFARSRTLALYAAAPVLATSLSASDPHWQPEEIAALLGTILATVFKNRVLANGLWSFLDGVCPAVCMAQLCARQGSPVIGDTPGPC